MASHGRAPAGQKQGVRQERAMDKQAQALVASFRLAEEEAYATEEAYVMGKFRLHKNLLYKLSSFLKNDILIKLFDDTLTQSP